MDSTLVILFVVLTLCFIFWQNNGLPDFRLIEGLAARGPVQTTPILPPTDPIVTESGMVKYLQNAMQGMQTTIQKNSLWCADGSCKVGNVILPEADLNSSLQMSQYIKGLNNQMYTSDNVKIYQNIFDAKNAKVIEKIGSPTGYDETTFVPGKEWNGRPIINYGTGANADKNGALIHVPADAEVLWLRCLNDRWIAVKAQVSSTGESLGRFAAGNRSLVNYAPDGTSGNDGYWNVHVWFPIPLPRNNIGDVIITGSGGSADTWLSGIAFTRNPWKHAVNSAVAYHWNINTPGTADNAVNNDATKTGIAWNSIWNNDQLITIQNNAPNGIALFYVPVVPSGKDKLVYIVEHNSNWVGGGLVSLTVNDKPIERFRASYDNPFARQFSGKTNCRYMAAKIPASYINTTDKFIKLGMNLSNTNNNIYVREIGTHDFFPTV